MNSFEKTFSPQQETVLNLYSSYSEVRKGQMFGNPAFFVGRKMIACFFQNSIGVKLPSQLVEKWVQSPGFSHFQPHGKPKMKEWIQINAIPQNRIETIRLVLEESVQFGIFNQDGGNHADN